MVRTAHRLAYVNKNIIADMVESSEFMYLVNKYRVGGVPHTVINEKHKFVGLKPDKGIVDEVLKAIQ